MTMLYWLIHAEKVNYPVVLLCRVLHVARSSYYAWREGEAARQVRRAAESVTRGRSNFDGTRSRLKGTGHLSRRKLSVLTGPW